MVDLFLRVDVAGRGRIGPGKIRLLEQIARTGSISAAGRAMGMSYRRAWDLVGELNGLFSSPVVTTQTGGIHGGGAALTPLASDLVARYRSLEVAAASIAVDHLATIEGLVEHPGRLEVQFRMLSPKNSSGSGGGDVSR